MESQRDVGIKGSLGPGPQQQLQLGLNKVTISTIKTLLSRLAASWEQWCHRCCLQVLSLRDMESVCVWQNCCQMSWMKAEAFQEMGVVLEPIKPMVLRCFD